ncbi:cobalt-precorrin-6A reductase [Pelagibacterium sp.]|uniref:cobalt-precorrin-6A reductase n=1 Tax=Pelagibacterium sp. TaxID=1967288 RepID=UPI003A8F1850
MSNRDTAGRRILMLGGTSEARALAGTLTDAGYGLITSLAGRTAAPRSLPGNVRIGGFGGSTGLADYLRANAIDLLVDATHPFAAQISANAVEAAREAGIPLLRLERPAWDRPSGANWVETGCIEDAADALPKGALALLTVGRQELAPFAARTDCRFVARMIDVPDRLPDDWVAIAARGPFTLEGELRLLTDYQITHLVTKNSGGAQVGAKLDAAAKLSIPMIVVARPHLPAAETLASVDDAYQAIIRVFRTD